MKALKIFLAVSILSVAGLSNVIFDGLEWAVLFWFLVFVTLTIVYYCGLMREFRNPKPKQRIPYPNEQALFAKVYEDRKFGRDQVTVPHILSDLEDVRGDVM